MAARNKILAGATKPLVKTFKNSKYQRTLTPNKETYLLPGDINLPASKVIFQAYNKRLSEVAPFGNGKFETYLNALYTYDYKWLREIDQTASAPIIAAMSTMAPVMQGMGTIIKIISGGTIPANKIMEAEYKKLKHMSLIYPTLAYYILNYEKYNKACVERNAVNMVVKYRWTEYGGYHQVLDSGGYDTHYKVNRRFLPAFKVLYKSDGDSEIKKISDRFFSAKNKIYHDELIKGTYRLMQKNCKSKIIWHIEPQMIRYFNDVKRRTDAAGH